MFEMRPPEIAFGSADSKFDALTSVLPRSLDIAGSHWTRLTLALDKRDTKKYNKKNNRAES